jgi:hypothetical protein
MSFFGEIGEFLSNPFSYTAGIFRDVISWMMPSPEKPASLDGVLINKQSSNAPIPVIYGARRVGGTRIFVNAAGANRAYLNIILVLAEGEIDSIGDVYYDGVINTDSKFAGLVAKESKRTGSNPQANLSLTTQYGTRRLHGLAYYAVQLKWDSKAFSNIPVITCDVLGKKVYNPATGVTAYSANPALCLRDYLTNTVYGKGLPASSIDDTLFNAAKTRCDTSVMNYTGGAWIKEFECNAVLDTSRSLMDNTKILLSGMRGIMPFSQGKYGLIIESEQVGANVLDLNESHIIGGIGINSGNQSGRYNQVSVTFINPDADWQPDDVFYPPADTSVSSDQTLFRAADGGKILLGKATLPTITDRYSAMGIAEAILKRSRFGKTVSIKVTSEALILTAGDIISITHSTPAWVSKKFRVLSTTLAVDGTIDLSLIEHDDSIYPWSTKTVLDAHSDTTLHDPSLVIDPTALTAVSSGNAVLNEDGSIVPVVQLSWTASADIFVEEYNVEVISSGTVIQELRTSTTGYEIRGLNVAASYTFKVYAVNSLGIKSTGVTSSAHTVSGKTTNPADPTSPSVTGELETLVVEWTNPTDNDFSHVEIRRHSTSTFSSASQIATIKGTTFVDNVGSLQKFYYWIRAVDATGNVSGWTTAASGTSKYLNFKQFPILGGVAPQGFFEIGTETELSMGIASGETGAWYVAEDNANSGSNAWSDALLSYHVFQAVPNLTLEFLYKPNSSGTFGGLGQDFDSDPRGMIGFSPISNLTASPLSGSGYRYSNLIHVRSVVHGHVNETELSGITASGITTTRDSWHRYRVVLKTEGYLAYVYQDNKWKLAVDDDTNDHGSIDSGQVRVRINLRNGMHEFAEMRVYEPENEGSLTSISESANTAGVVGSFSSSGKLYAEGHEVITAENDPLPITIALG